MRVDASISIIDARRMVGAYLVQNVWLVAKTTCKLSAVVFVNQRVVARSRSRWKVLLSVHICPFPSSGANFLCI